FTAPRRLEIYPFNDGAGHTARLLTTSCLFAGATRRSRCGRKIGWLNTRRCRMRRPDAVRWPSSASFTNAGRRGPGEYLTAAQEALTTLPPSAKPRGGRNTTVSRPSLADVTLRHVRASSLKG